MNDIININISGMIVGYILLLVPLAIILYQRVPILKDTAIALVRMTVQLLFVGFYLQYLFKLNNVWLNLLWLLVMMVVADGSIIRGCRLRASCFAIPVFIALFIGTAIPVLVFVGIILRRPDLLDAQYAIPIGGMVLGNCLRADIIGLHGFYESIRTHEKAYHHTLAQGARLQEAIAPYVRDALQSALMPTVASMAVIGLVALPGMMTGTVLAGANPMIAIKYQIIIMVGIFTGTTITVFAAIRFTTKNCFNPFGVLDRTIFRSK
ncbi:MAG: ABC transporter permease [Sedimentisphaerales bacterium]|nr:ABC transporter permease [Sedimentisphaerales bacterium]